MKEKILKLRAEGKTYEEIHNILNCASSTVSYYCNPSVKEKSSIRGRKRNKDLNHIFKRKKDNFQSIGGWRFSPKNPTKMGPRKRVASLFTADQLKEKFFSNPVCYLTGEKIDLSQPKTYHLDHIHPVAKGGSNSLENCGLTIKAANVSKSDMTLSEYLDLCKKVLENHGFFVKKMAADVGIPPTLVISDTPISSREHLNSVNLPKMAATVDIPSTLAINDTLISSEEPLNSVK